MSEISGRKKIVIVGAGGRLGKHLTRFLQAEHEVIDFDRQQLDLRLVTCIDAVLEDLEYDYLFLTGALTAVDYCETHEAEAFSTNRDGPGRIAQISAAKAAHVTYISTDFVFDGSKDGLYFESDEPNPVSVYGASKLAGERAVLAASSANLVARVSWVYGPDRSAFPEWIVGNAVKGSALTLPEDKIGCSTCTNDLVGWLKALTLDLNSGPASGIIHLCNSGPCTWQEWGQACIDLARESGIQTEAATIGGVPLDSVPAFVAKRPLNSALDTSRFSELTGIRPRPWETALRDFVVQSDSFLPYRLHPYVP